MAALSVASGCDDPVGFLTKRLLLLESSSQLSSFQNSTTLKSEHILLFTLIYVYWSLNRWSFTQYPPLLISSLYTYSMSFSPHGPCLLVSILITFSLSLEAITWSLLLAEVIRWSQSFSSSLLSTTVCAQTLWKHKKLYAIKIYCFTACSHHVCSVNSLSLSLSLSLYCLSCAHLKFSMFLHIVGSHSIQYEFCFICNSNNMVTGSVR